MQLIKLIVVLVVVISRICSANILINVDKPDDFEALGDAAIQILTTCSATKVKTIAIDGDFPGNFIKKLSATKSHSLLQLDRFRRSTNNIARLSTINWKRTQKVNVVVTIVANPEDILESSKDLQFSLYENPMALILAIVWPPKEKYASCDGKSQTAKYFRLSDFRNHLKTVLICHDRKKRIMMYTYNPFTTKAPEPWQRIPFQDTVKGRHFSYFTRQYRDHEDNCKNLDYEKTQDLGLSDIKVLHFGRKPMGNYSGDAAESSVKIIMIESKMIETYIYNFIAHVNGTKKHVWRLLRLGQRAFKRDDELIVVPMAFNAARPRVMDQITYPYGEDCKFLISQFRGNKSQLQKILDVIDVYSWIGLCLVYLLTLVFLRYFFQQPLSAGTLNLIRLTTNSGIVTSRPNVSSQIYMGCLLFVVVTMHGIFTGNLAALLTHDFPVRQINLIQDVVDLNYKIHVHTDYQMFFDKRVPKSRIILRGSNDDCLEKVRRDLLSACLDWGAQRKHRALELKLHVGTECIFTTQSVHFLPFRWPLREKLNGFLMWSLATGIMLPLNAIVTRKRLLEEESQEVVLEPRIMVFGNLHFAFNILGLGLICASVCFIGELIVDRYNRKVTTTRVIILNQSGPSST